MRGWLAVASLLCATPCGSIATHQGDATTCFATVVSAGRLPLMKALLVTFAVICLSTGMAVVHFSGAEAHPTGNERRTVAACMTLKKKPKRRACKRCVRRKRPHHFHPRAKARHRCRINNGRP